MRGIKREQRNITEIKSHSRRVDVVQVEKSATAAIVATVARKEETLGSKLAVLRITLN